MILKQFHAPFPLPTLDGDSGTVTEYETGRRGVVEILATPLGVLVTAGDGRMVRCAGGGWCAVATVAVPEPVA